MLFLYADETVKYEGPLTVMCTKFDASCFPDSTPFTMDFMPVSQLCGQTGTKSGHAIREFREREFNSRETLRLFQNAKTA